MSPVSFTAAMHQKYPEILQTCYDISVPTGWEDVIEQLLKELTLVSRKIEVFKIKEKFGRLRVYLRESHLGVSEESTEIYKTIEAAARQCAVCCAICGKEGTLQNSNGWWAVLCHEHE